jgi:hypothetical protein
VRATRYHYELASAPRFLGIIRVQQALIGTNPMILFEFLCAVTTTRLGAMNATNIEVFRSSDTYTPRTTETTTVLLGSAI